MREKGRRSRSMLLSFSSLQILFLVLHSSHSFTLTDTENPKDSHFVVHLRTMASLSCYPVRRPPYIPNYIPDPLYVRILDTTLRDGEQSPGASLNSKQKLDIARRLAKLGVDIIDAGFPAASKDDFQAVKSIAQVVGNAVDDDGYVPVIAGSCRCTETDITSAWEAVKYAKRPRIKTFIATSAIHMEYKLQKTKEQVIEIAHSMVKLARRLGCDDVGFCAEDAARFPLRNSFLTL